MKDVNMQLLCYENALALPCTHIAPAPAPAPAALAVSRFQCRSDLYEMDLLLDVNIDVYPLHVRGDAVTDEAVMAEQAAAAAACCITARNRLHVLVDMCSIVSLMSLMSRRGVACHGVMACSSKHPRACMLPAGE